MTADIRRLIANDLKPVHPLLPPTRRALALVPLAIAIVVGVPLVEVFRTDLLALGFFRAWGLSILESAAGLAIVALGLRESVPGRSMTTGTLWITTTLGLALPLAAYAMTTDTFDVGPSSWSEWREGLVCLRVSMTATAPLLVASALLVARGLPVRPTVAGLLYGLGCGLVADAGLRLYCEFTTPQHVILEHFGAVVASMIIGALVATVASRSR